MSMSGDGRFLVVGSPNEVDSTNDNIVGAVQVYFFNNSLYIQFGQRLSGTNYIGPDVSQGN